MQQLQKRYRPGLPILYFTNLMLQTLLDQINQRMFETSEDLRTLYKDVMWGNLIYDLCLFWVKTQIIIWYDPILHLNIKLFKTYPFPGQRLSQCLVDTFQNLFECFQSDTSFWAGKVGGKRGEKVFWKSWVSADDTTWPMGFVWHKAVNNCWGNLQKCHLI